MGIKETHRRSVWWNSVPLAERVKLPFLGVSRHLVGMRLPALRLSDLVGDPGARESW